MKNGEKKKIQSLLMSHMERSLFLKHQLELDFNGIPKGSLSKK